MTSAVHMHRSALAQGYRQIDCASFYGNETTIGEGLADFIKEKGREQLFVTSKVWNDAHRPQLVRCDPCSLLLVSWGIGPWTQPFSLQIPRHHECPKWVACHTAIPSMRLAQRPCMACTCTHTCTYTYIGSHQCNAAVSHIEPELPELQ